MHSPLPKLERQMIELIRVRNKKSWKKEVCTVLVSVIIACLINLQLQILKRMSE